MKLALSYTEVINGRFNLGPINLMMVFQVNCPGCFIHGFPLIKELQAHYGDQLSSFVLSTAFEDFKLNTVENARLLVSSGTLVGETLKAKESRMLTWDRSNLSVPFLVDEVVNQSELLSPGFIDGIINNMFDRPMTDLELKKLKSSLHEYFIRLPKCGKTFAANLLRGTPSFVLFTDSMEVLLQWFGHADSRSLKRELDQFFIASD